MMIVVGTVVVGVGVGYSEGLVAAVVLVEIDAPAVIGDFVDSDVVDCGIVAPGGIEIGYFVDVIDESIGIDVIDEIGEIVVIDLIGLIVEIDDSGLLLPLFEPVIDPNLVDVVVLEIEIEIEIVVLIAAEIDAVGIDAADVDAVLVGVLFHHEGIDLSV